MKESGAVELVDPEWPDVLYEGNDSRHEGFAKDENAEPNEDLIKALGFLHAEGREIGW